MCQRVFDGRGDGHSRQAGERRVTRQHDGCDRDSRHDRRRRPGLARAVRLPEKTHNP